GILRKQEGGGMSGNTASTTEGQFDAFLARRMAPLPQEALHDQSYNRRLRAARGKTRRTVEAELRVQRASLDLYDAVAHSKRVQGDNSGIIMDEGRIGRLDLLRKQIGILLLTPAPDRAALGWKKKHLPYIHANSTEQEREIASEVD